MLVYTGFTLHAKNLHSVITVPANVPAPNNDRPSAATLLTTTFKTYFFQVSFTIYYFWYCPDNIIPTDQEDFMRYQATLWGTISPMTASGFSIYTSCKVWPTSDPETSFNTLILINLSQSHLYGGYMKYQSVNIMEEWSHMIHNGNSPLFLYQGFYNWFFYSHFLISDKAILAPLQASNNQHNVIQVMQ